MLSVMSWWGTSVTDRGAVGRAGLADHLKAVDKRTASLERQHGDEWLKHVRRNATGAAQGHPFGPATGLAVERVFERSWRHGGGMNRRAAMDATVARRLHWMTPQSPAADTATERQRAPVNGHPADQDQQHEGRQPVAAEGPRHCWVVGLEGRPDRMVGVVLEWQRPRDGWRAMVFVAVPGTLGTLMWIRSENPRP
jgi:hypothetical protein